MLRPRPPTDGLCRGILPRGSCHDSEFGALVSRHSAGRGAPAPWHLYRLMLHTAVGVANRRAPHGATRWDFACYLLGATERRGCVTTA
jgi:hypothetical protein